MPASKTGFPENAVMKRTFKTVATISGLIERNIPGSTRRTGRQTVVSSDILYDTLRKYEPDHLLLRLTRQEAMRGIVDFFTHRGHVQSGRGPNRPSLALPCHATCRAAPSRGRTSSDFRERRRGAAV